MVTHKSWRQYGRGIHQNILTRCGMKELDMLNNGGKPFETEFYWKDVTCKLCRAYWLDAHEKKLKKRIEQVKAAHKKEIPW